LRGGFPFGSQARHSCRANDFLDCIAAWEQAELGESGGYDLFGNALGNDAFMDFAAKYVVRRRNELARDVSYLTTNVKRRNAAEMAKKYGVDIKDAEGMKRKLAQINLLRERWKNPYSDPELMKEMKAAYRSGLGAEGAAGASIPESARQSVHAGVVADTGLRAMRRGCWRWRMCFTAVWRS